MEIMLVKNNFKTTLFEQEQRAKSSTVISCAPDTEENIYAIKMESLFQFCLVGVTIRTR
jgi:hypothetical protein